MKEAGGKWGSHAIAAVSVENTLAFKADLQIPWNKLREMRR